ncbi:MAG: hypothetical protein JWR19_3555 [Pedosphaera sp.]|jgi:molecular chaperone GrpE (heat shock protein)|nr:hypothetical protein [Pedosphaera sp.]
MSNQTEPKLCKWPFFLGDAVLIGLAMVIYWQSKLPMGNWQIVLFVVSGALGALLAVLPYLLEFQAMVRLGEADALVSATAQMKNLELIAVQISAATAQWQMVQEESGKTVGAAKEIAERISGEAVAFSDFLQKANDGERANLRLEVEKLRRAEGDWLQVVVRMLDHTFALHQAAVRSGQQGLVEQLGHFQHACRDVARRLGIVPFAPTPNEPFDAQIHQVADGQEAPASDAKVGETVATGYTFQGQLLRPALVTLRGEAVLNAAAAQAEGIAAAPAISGAVDLLEEQSLL